MLGCLLAAMLPATGCAQGVLSERLRERVGAREPAAGGIELAYGGHDRQRLDYWRPREAGAPLVVFVHGGGWKHGDKRHTAETKAAHFLGQGYAFASVNYRLVPKVTVEEQAQDVASALAHLVKRAKRLGLDPQNVVLMGHSAGAHLAALVGTDPQYLRGAGLGMEVLKGVIPLDGACYDVPRQISDGGPLMRGTYVEAFGEDPARQLALSPAHHAKAPNAAAFLILHVRRQDGAAQSKALAKALQQAGTPAEVREFPGRGLRGHAEINRRLGEPAYPPTAVVDEWLKQVFGEKKAAFRGG